MVRSGSFILFLFLSVFSAAQQGINLRGRVCDSRGKAVAGATVYLHETLQGAQSNDSGYFLLPDVKRGSYHLHATFVGYHAYTRDILVSDSSGFLYIQLTESNLELHEVVVESNSLKLEKSEYSINTQVVNEEMLRKNQGPTLSNALEMLPGINSINMGVGVSKPVIRGLSGNRILVAENGIKQEGQQWGGDHGLELDPFNAERIEIVKGPASLLYGSDAMGGVIHIKQPLIPVSGKHEAAVAGIYRSVNHSLGSSLSARGNQKGWVYRFRFSHLDYADYAVPADSFTYNRYVLPVFGQKLKNTAGKERHLSGQLGLHRNWGYTRISVSNFHQQIGVFSGAIGIPRSYNLQPDGDVRNLDLPNQRINHFKVIANSNFRFGPNWLETDLGYQHNLRLENSAPHAHGQPASNDTRAHELVLQTLSGNLRFHHQEKKRMQVFGLSGQYQTHRFAGFEFLVPNYEAVQTGAFYFGKIRLNPRYTFNAGIRMDYGSIHIHRHEQAVYKDGQQTGYQERVAENDRRFWNWSGALGLAANVNSALGFKVNLGKSFRIPSPQELSVNGVHHGSFRHELGDPGLKAEESYQADAGVSYEKKNWYLEVNPYFTYFHNYIFLRPTARFSELSEAGQVFVFEQARAIMAGGEFSAEFHPVRSLHIESGLEYVYAQNLASALPLPFIPPMQWKGGVEYTLDKKLAIFEKTYFRLNWVLASAQERTDRNEAATPGYGLLHLGAGSHIWFGKKYKAELSINVRNLLNTAYYNHLSRWRYLNLPEPGRNVNVQLLLPLY